jgi:hypothetical protein
VAPAGIAALRQAANSATLPWLLFRTPNYPKNMSPLLLIIIILLLVDGGGFYYGGPVYGGGGLGLVLVILLILFLTGSFGRRPKL